MSAERVCDLSCGAMHEFALVLDKAGFDADLVKKITGSRGNKLAKTMRGSIEEKIVVPVGTTSVNPDISFMAPIYEKLFGKVPDFTELLIPRVPDARSYIAIPVMREIIEYTNGAPKEGLHQARKKLFQCWKYTDDSLDTAIPSDKDERNSADGSYVVLMLDSETPDEEFLNHSTNQIAGMNVKTSTYTEYALFSVAYFLKHGHHPDRKTWTLNSGSRSRGGGVPGGYWGGGGSDVGWCSLGYRYANLGPRRVWA